MFLFSHYVSSRKTLGVGVGTSLVLLSETVVSSGAVDLLSSHARVFTCLLSQPIILKSFHIFVIWLVLSLTRLFLIFYNSVLLRYSWQMKLKDIWSVHGDDPTHIFFFWFLTAETISAVSPEDALLFPVLSSQPWQREVMVCFSHTVRVSSRAVVQGKKLKIMKLSMSLSPFKFKKYYSSLN